MEQPARRLSVRRPREIQALVFDESDRILGDRLIARGQNCSIVGPSGLGKSRLMLQAAVANQADIPFLGFATRRTEGPWLFVQAENSNRRLKDDLDRLETWVGTAVWEHRVNTGIYLHTIETDYDGFLALGDPGNQRAIKELNGDLKPAVTIYDCLANFAQGDLNNDAEMMATLCLLAQLTKTGDPERVPCVLHHARVGRAGATSAVGFDRAAYSKGSKALHGWTRGQINVAQGNEEGSVLVIACGKCSDGKEFKPFAARLNAQTMIYELEEGFDMVAWRSQMAKGKAPPISSEDVASICNGGMSPGDLFKTVADRVKCSERTARRYVERAESDRKIRFSKHDNFYHAKEPF